MKQFIVVMGIAALMGCNLSLTNPLDVVPGAEVDPAPYIGTWQIVDVGGQAPAQTTTTVVQEVPAGVTFSLAGQVAGTARLTTIGADVYASVDSATGSWNIVKVSLLDEGDTMILATMDSEVVEQDIASAVIAGEIVSIDADTQHVSVTGTGPELRNYIAARPALFSTIGIHLVKVP